MVGRRRISARERVRIFEREGGTCHLCAGKVHVGEAWDVSHDIPLAIGGDDSDENRRVAHRKCHRAHTASVDAPRIAKTARQEQKHLGIRKRATMPGSRASKWKRTIAGYTVDRETGERI